MHHQREDGDGAGSGWGWAEACRFEATIEGEFKNYDKGREGFIEVIFAWKIKTLQKNMLAKSAKIMTTPMRGFLMRR